MLLSEICNLDVIVAPKDCSVSQAAKLMRNYHVGSVIVIEKENGISKPIGIVTDRDIIIEVLAQEVPVNSISLGDIMTRVMITGKENDELWDTIQRMRVNGIRRLPVVNSDGALLGIVSMDDIIELLAEELSSLSRVITLQQNREAQHRLEVI